MAEPPDLLFFDTFSHESSEELNLDLVQFPKPVYVSEVRIIPLGARVQGDFPGGVRLGATNPSQFQIDFFVNDLSKQGASTFETLGSLDYCQNGRIHMDCESIGDSPRQIPTDGLVLRGWYTTITLAVYGTITKNITEQIGANATSVEGAPPPPAPIPTPPAVAAAPQPWSDVPPEAYPAADYPPDDYDPPNYPPEYFNQDAPKDPRGYHHAPNEGDVMWDVREDKPARDISREREKDRSRQGSVGRDAVRVRSRSIERPSRNRNSPRYSRSRSRDRDYHSMRRDHSRSPVYRDRSISREKDWDRDRSYKRDDYRRHRQSSYERSRGSSYEKKRGSPYEKRGPSFEQRPPSYEGRAPSYEKRLSPYEKRGSSYEKRYDKRATSYDRLREPSYDNRSRSPGRDDPRKRPRTPPLEHSRRPRTPLDMGGLPRGDRDRGSPIESVHSDEGADYDRGSKVAKEDPYGKAYKGRKIKSDPDKPHLSKDSYDNFTVKSEHSFTVKTEHGGLLNVNVNVNEGTVSPNVKPNTPLVSPTVAQEDNNSIHEEPFEPILSDEDICDDAEGTFADDDDMNEYCGIEEVLKCFNPFRSDWQEYVPVYKPPLFLLANNAKDVMSASIEELCALNPSFQKLFELVSDCKKMDDKYSITNFALLSGDAKEEWIEICEQLPPLIISIGMESDILYRIFHVNDAKDACHEDMRSILKFLINFCNIGLNYDLALSQNQATYKIRHIKCGIRLIDALSSHKYNEVAIMSLLSNEIEVFVKLLELYSKDYMALSIKLMILKAIDSCLGSEATIEHFLTKSYSEDLFMDQKDKNHENECDKPNFRNGYQILLVMLTKNPLSRIKYAINALINKVNCYELLKKFHHTILQLNARDEVNRRITQPEIEFIINALEEFLCIYRNNSFGMSQPRRFLPVSAQFEINKVSSNDTLINFFRMHKLLETFSFLLTCPVTYNYPVITNPIYELLAYLINSHEGLLYLVENIKMCHLLFQTLMQPFTQQNEEDQIMILQEYSNCTSLQHLGLEMAYKIQAHYYINALFDLERKSEDNEGELFDNLHGLYCLMFGNIGKLAVANVLTMGDNIQCLLNVFEKDANAKISDKDENQIVKNKSPTKNYAVDMTVLAVQFASDIPFLKKYGRKILSIAKKFDIFEQSIASNLQEVLPYLKPLEKSNIFSNDNLCDLVEILKTSIEHVTSAPGDLITCLRILRYLSIPETETKKLPLSENLKVEFTELKYKYVVIQLYSLDGVSLMVSILEKMCSYFEQPCLHSATFASLHGLHLANIVLPALELLNKMLTYVIQCRNTQFKDSTSVPVVLQTYNLMHSYPATSIGHKTAQRACRECIEILLAHTQPMADENGENEYIHRSLWTRLCGEIIKYTLTAPYTLIPGLLVFSEVLPLPVPVQTKYPLSQAELASAVSDRRLWSAHLHALSPSVAETIQTVCLSACQPAVQLLRRVCFQLSDLAANMALCVTKAVLDLFVAQMGGAGPPETLPPLNYDVARILNFLACLVGHAPIKCSILHVIRPNASKTDDKYAAFVPLLSLILTTPGDVQSHVQAQECVVSIISSFYDSEITLLTQFDSTSQIKNEDQDSKTMISPDVYLANAVPHKDTLLVLINASLDYISGEGAQLPLTLAILRTFFLLTEHDYGFYYFKSCIDKNKPAFLQILTRLVSGVSKESPECLNVFMDLLKVLQSTAEDLEQTEGLQFIPRTNVLTINDISDLIGWNKVKENHPLVTLDTFLKEVNADDELSTNVRNLLASLSNSTTAITPTPESSITPIPPVIGSPETLVVQFGGRCLWTQGDARDERLGTSYWLGINFPHNEDYALESEMIPCDLTELTRNYLPPGTDLVTEAERLLHLPPAAPRPPSEPPLFRTKRLHVPRDKRPYVSPARGRGMSQQMGSSLGGVGGGGPRNQVDAFRSRPPNTSRPPSLHVDDFLALEGCGAQPTGPTGYNKLPAMSNRGGRGTRSRGITITDRGRFASATPTTSTIYRRGRGNWNTNSANNNSEGSPPSHYSRVSASQHYQPPISQHSSSVGWGGGNRGRRGRGIRHGRSSFLR